MNFPVVGTESASYASSSRSFGVLGGEVLQRWTVWSFFASALDRNGQERSVGPPLHDRRKSLSYVFFVYSMNNTAQ